MGKNKHGKTAEDLALDCHNLLAAQLLRPRRPLQVFAKKVEDTIALVCNDLGGQQLDEFTLPPNATFGLLAEQIDERLPISRGRWQIILANGEIPDESQSDITLSTLFG